MNAIFTICLQKENHHESPPSTKPSGQRKGTENMNECKSSEVLLRKIQRGEITINEAREEMGMNPIDMAEFNQLLQTAQEKGVQYEH